MNPSLAAALSIAFLLPIAIDPLRAADRTAIQAPRRALEWIHRGDALMQQSRENLEPALYPQARAAYEQALALDARAFMAMVGLAWVANSEHDFESGEAWCRRALALDENLPDAWSLLGDAAVEHGEYQHAIDCYQRALDLRPDLASYSRAAHVLWLTGEPGRARELMTAAVRAGGAHAEPIAWCTAELAKMHFRAGAVETAHELLTAALPRAPRNPHLLNAAGHVMAARGELEPAIRMFEQSQGIVATHDALTSLVDLYELADRHDDAARQIARVLAFHGGIPHEAGDTCTTCDPHDSVHESAHDHEHGHMHPHERGHDHDDGAPRQHHAHAHPHGDGGNVQLARFLADHGLHLDYALHQAEAAWNDTPNIEAATTLAWCLHRLRRHEPAAAALTHALRWRTPDPELHYRAGAILAAAGETARGREHLGKALTLNPRFHPRLAEEARALLDTLTAGR